MPEIILSDYFYGGESEEFIYFKIPPSLNREPEIQARFHGRQAALWYVSASVNAKQKMSIFAEMECHFSAVDKVQ